MYFYFLLKKKINSVNFNPLRSFKRQQLIKNIPLFKKKKKTCFLCCPLRWQYKNVTKSHNMCTVFKYRYKLQMNLLML